MYSERSRIGDIEGILDHLFGEWFYETLQDRRVTDIFFLPNDLVYMKRAGKKSVIRKAGKIDEHKKHSAATQLAGISGKVYSEGSPEIAMSYVHHGVRVRVQAVLPPVVSSTLLAFRVLNGSELTLDDYVRAGSLSNTDKELLISYVQSKKNIIVAGSTGSGKTTLTQALLGYIDREEYVYIIEDTPELVLSNKLVVQVCTKSSYPSRKAIQDSLRCSPDRILLGEVRDGSILELLKAWNTGHPGGIATLHASSLQKVNSRIEDLLYESMPKVPERMVHENIDICIFIENAIESGKETRKIIMKEEI